jgi:hypothetical protein
MPVGESVFEIKLGPEAGVATGMTVEADVGFWPAVPLEATVTWLRSRMTADASPRPVLHPH